MAVESFGGEIKEITGIFCEKIRKIIVKSYIQLISVIKTRSFELFIVNYKTHWADYM